MVSSGMIIWIYIWFRKDGSVSVQQFVDLAVDIFLNGFLTLDRDETE